MSLPNNNYDEAELKKFNAAAATWWDKNGKFHLLHEMNPLRCNWIDTRSPVAEKNYLDIGCGGGFLCEAMTQRGALVTGIDVAQETLGIARNHASQSNLSINYLETTAETLAQQHNETYDIVSCLEMLEHVPDPASVVKACAQLVSPNGHVYFSTINRNPVAYLGAILLGEYVLNLLPRGTHQYAKLIRPSELNTWLENAGLICREISGIHLNPISKKFSLSADPTINYIVHAVKL